jgi:hypothetical protein
MRTFRTNAARAAIGLLLSTSFLSACDSNGGDGEPTTVGEGDLYPALTVSDCDGNPVDLRAYLASKDASYLTFGAKWCVACQEEAPIINSELVDGLAGQNVGVAQILIEGDAGSPPTQAFCAAWKSDLSARYDVFVDTAQAHLEPVFGGAIATLPLHLIVTKDGIIRLFKPGAIPEDIKGVVSGWLP